MDDTKATASHPLLTKFDKLNCVENTYCCRLNNMIYCYVRIERIQPDPTGRRLIQSVHIAFHCNIFFFKFNSYTGAIFFRRSDREIVELQCYTLEINPLYSGNRYA